MASERPELQKRAVNHVALSPVSFLKRAATFFPDRLAVAHGARRITYAELYARCRRLAHALHQAGVRPGDTVAICAANVPAMLEAHYAVPMLGAVLNPINTRLDARAIAFCLDHGRAHVLLADREYHAALDPAISLAETRPLVVDIADAETEGAPLLSHIEYEAFIAGGDPDYAYRGAHDEWESITLLYTSGTTGNPKGAVGSHRAAYLNALSNALTFGLGPESRYLWTLPMFHCSGWTYTWAVTAVAGTHVCLRRVDPKRVFELIAEHRVTHMCGAPIVLNMLVHAPDAVKRPLAAGHRPRIMTGGAAPPSIVLQNMEAMGFEVVHAYGTTESYGPSTTCVPDAAWGHLPAAERYVRMARQGVPMVAYETMIVADPETGEEVPRDGATLGEIMVQGNALMKGYLGNPVATEAAFAGGLYRSGDLAVWHPDRTIEVKDRSKDIIISGGENISSLEVEEVLYRHPAVLEAAVVARPDERWGESPCAFVTLKDGAAATADDIVAFCRANMASFKIPKRIVFGPLPKTSTGKIQKFELRARAKGV